MKLTTLVSASTLVLSATLVLTTPFIGDTEVGDEKLYVNPHGEIVIPEEFPWGHYVMKEKDAARNRTTCMGGTDPSGRLGKRQAYCPSGYILACDAYAASPCCPNETPVCCSGGTVCCATGQFCQGTTTCCNAGQIGCGEGCCKFGEICCEDKCCGAGTTCENGQCKNPYDGYVPPTPTYTYHPPNSTTSDRTYTPPTYGPGYTPVEPTYGNPYPPGVTIAVTSYIYTAGPPTPSCTRVVDGPRVVVIGAAVGACLGAFAIIMAALSAWLWRKNRACEAELAGYRHPPTQPPPTQPPVDTPKPGYQSTPETPKPEELTYGNNNNSTQPGYGSTPAPPPANNY
ncbi:hypothetical protein M408DRAFT_265826 [Serendipita vermifera MAFF 305830]|uniref:Carbohydrate-binding module family 18 protein n=1 Tax=Serendipita vermifera MAFF 305830 TaxID=933852 RepID=A0A0C2X127_SERVB|nr:hypothetical protein M408DRAFT_265826 [Serendipita vermifera MAFF 305830]